MAKSKQKIKPRTKKTTRFNKMQKKNLASDNSLKRDSIEVKQNLAAKFKQLYKNLISFFRQNALLTVILLFIALLSLIIVADQIRKENIPQINDNKPVKQVNTYQVGQAPTIEIQATIEKQGVITIVAQTAGVVQRLNVTEGDQVWRGSQLAYISSNYQGGNAASINRQIAQKQYQFNKDNLDLQKELLNKRKDLANKQAANSEELRKITQQSIDDTKANLALNEEILQTIDENLQILEEATPAARDDEAILATKQLKASYLSAVAGLRSQLRSAEYQADEDSAINDLATVQKDMTLKQLELEEKSLALSLEISQLQVRLAQVAESLHFPASPAEGVIERVHVSPGQMVNPGTTLFTISSDLGVNVARALVAKKIAQQMSIYQAAQLNINGESLNLTPTYIANEATDGQLYAVKYILPEASAAKLTNKQQITLTVPVTYSQSSATVPFIPIDSVYQSNFGSYVYVVADGAAQAKQLELGEVYGEYVLVKSGLDSSEQIILDRTVIEGDLVEVN